MYRCAVYQESLVSLFFWELWHFRIYDFFVAKNLSTRYKCTPGVLSIGDNEGCLLRQTLKLKNNSCMLYISIILLYKVLSKIDWRRYNSRDQVFNYKPISSFILKNDYQYYDIMVLLISLGSIYLIGKSIGGSGIYY